ncbi:phage tail protein [Nesterenkonia massiliensis]|uniref:Phage tail protein n=1 Tax=Nesterenkonia massiliensis TaxID=1232429 RepID=A0ABT2HR63_9MICC|nr:phage tail protein [Nesterenkonia massiliensis]MCT1607151.1 phage tail protein [Nesterenkonia massiliensis]
MTTQRLWTNRFHYSGEIPTNYPGLNPTAIARINELGTGSGTYQDGVTPSRNWQMHWGGTSALWGRAAGRTGGRLQINASGANVERGRLQLTHFSGLWPGAGSPAVLVGGWFWQTYEMAFNPLIDTRATDPFVYLSTAGASGQPRMQVYSATGALLLDQYEAGMPWVQTTDGYFLGMIVRGNSAQLFSVHSDGRRWIGPVRTFTGTPNWASSANVDLFSLRHGSYWEAGFLDDVVIAHPDAAFDLDQFVDDLSLSVWANGFQRPTRDGDFIVTDTSISSNNASNRVFSTGAERLSWPAKPTFSVPSGQLLYSTDDGRTWQDANGGADLPEVADGILLRRANMQLGTAAWTGMDITIPDPADVEVVPTAPVHDAETNTVTVTAQTGVIWSQVGVISIPEGASVTITASPAPGYAFPAGATTSWEFAYTWPAPPTLGPIPNVTLEQGAEQPYTVPLTFTAAMGPHTWSVRAPSLATVTVADGILSVAVGFETGTQSATVLLTDGIGRAVERSFTITVTPRPWDDPPPPIYPNAPIVLWEDGAPAEVLVDPLSAVVIDEVNGQEAFELSLPAGHRLARLIVNENVVEAAGERYWIRRVRSGRVAGMPVLKVYAEARFYELGTAGGIDPQEWSQVLPGPVMETALRGTGWRLGTVNVGTRRTYQIEQRTNPLALLRLVQSQHGGDLIFDNTNRVVNLVVQSGRDQGVGFFYSSNLNSAERVVDTSSLVTRIYARNEDGLTIASVNGGQPYLEDFGYTDEVKSTTYNFKAGTSPYTMLEMTRATLAHRSKPDVSYECKVSDLSAESGMDLDRFTCGDLVTVADPEVGIDGETQRIVRLEYDLLRPWNSAITLSAKLRETGSGDGGEDSLATGSTIDTFDLVPYNLLLNSRFDNGLAHWANSGATVVETERGTGDYAVRFAGSGRRWIEQTITPDNRAAYAFSMQLDSSGGPEGWSPDVMVQAEVTYEDGEVELIELDLGGDTDYAGETETE